MVKRESWYNVLLERFKIYKRLKMRREILLIGYKELRENDKYIEECEELGIIDQRINEIDNAILMLTKVQQFLIRTKFLEGYYPLRKSDADIMNIVRDYAKRNGIRVSNTRTYQRLKSEGLKGIAIILEII